MNCSKKTFFTIHPGSSNKSANQRINVIFFQELQLCKFSWSKFTTQDECLLSGQSSQCQAGIKLSERIVLACIMVSIFSETWFCFKSPFRHCWAAMLIEALHWFVFNMVQCDLDYIIPREVMWLHLPTAIWNDKNQSQHTSAFFHIVCV